MRIPTWSRFSAHDRRSGVLSVIDPPKPRVIRQQAVRTESWGAKRRRTEKRAGRRKSAGKLHLEPKSAGGYAAQNKSAGVYGQFSAIFRPYTPTVFTTDPDIPPQFPARGHTSCYLPLFCPINIKQRHPMFTGWRCWRCSGSAFT